MADAILVLGPALPERAAEGRIEEERVVAEAVRAPRLLRDEAFDRLLRVEQDLASAHDRDRARETRAALLPGHPAQLLEEQPVAVGVRGVLAAEAAGVEAGPAVERVDGEARVVGHGQESRATRVVARLEDGVLAEGRPRLFRGLGNAQVVGSHDAEREARHQLPHLRQLARVLAGEEEVGHRAIIRRGGRGRTRLAPGPARYSRISCRARRRSGWLPSARR